MEKPQVNNNQPVNYLILDTNIISRVRSGTHTKGKSVISPIIIKFLSELLKRSVGNWDIAISSITLFELMDKAPIKIEVENQQAIKDMETFDVNNEVLRGAGRLGSFYKNENINDSQISIADKIIGATSQLTGSIIYTTDMRDYPAPFFSEIVELRKIIEYKNGSGLPVFLPTYFMSPEGDTVMKYLTARNEPVKTGKLKESLKLSSVKNLIN